MGLSVLDASISIAIVDDADVLYDAAAHALGTSAELVLPAAAYTETMVRPYRDGIAEAVRDKLAALGIRVEPVTESIAEEAARLRARVPSLRPGDALVIATAVVLDADELLTGDRRWAAVWDRVRVLEPEN